MSNMYNAFGGQFDTPVGKEEMLKKGGLDWDVSKEPLTYEFDGRKVVSSNHVAVVRDNGDELGVVRKTFGLVQNDELADICEVWNENGEASYLAATSLGRGERIIIAMKAPNAIKLGPQDSVENTFFVTSGHDGTEAIVGQCAPLHTGSDTILIPAWGRRVIKVKHSKHVRNRLAAAHSIMRGVRDLWTDFEESFQLFQSVRITTNDAMTYFKTCLMREEDTKRDISVRIENMASEMLKIYTTGVVDKMPYAKGTLLGAYLAVNHYVDHFKTVRTSKHFKDEFSAHIAATLLGDGARLKGESYGFCLKLTAKLKAARG